VAERVLVRRGEYIGRKDLTVLAATWSKVKDCFEVINAPKLPGEEKEKEKEKDKGFKILGDKEKDKEKEKEKENKDKEKDKDKKFAAPPASGISLDFTGSRALLVDFEGGPKGTKGGSFAVKVNVEESAMDLLILNPDGKLVVRNSHRDYHLEERVIREHENQERLKSLMQASGDQPDRKGQPGILK
jgi:hypothetical protein